MAPRRSGSSYYSNSQICDGAFEDFDMQVTLAYSVLFALVFLLIFAAWFFVRKRSGRTGKKLIGIPYISAVVLMLISNLLDIASLVVVACDTASYYSDYVNMIVASNIIFALGAWLLFFVAVYTLNAMLSRSQHFAGQHSSPVFKLLPLVVVAVMLPLVCASLGLSAYNSLARATGRTRSLDPIYDAALKLNVAVRALYLVGVIVGAVLAGMSVMKTRAIGMSWIIVLFFSMLIWNIISLISVAQNLAGVRWSLGSASALSYIQGAFQALAFITLMGIAKHPSWDNTNDMVQQDYTPVWQQHATTTYEGGAQQAVYQPPAVYDAPVYVHAK